MVQVSSIASLFFFFLLRVPCLETPPAPIERVLDTMHSPRWPRSWQLKTMRREDMRVCCPLRSLYYRSRDDNEDSNLSLMKSNSFICLLLSSTISATKDLFVLNYRRPRWNLSFRDSFIMQQMPTCKQGTLFAGVRRAKGSRKTIDHGEADEKAICVEEIFTKIMNSIYSSIKFETNCHSR